MLFLGSPEGRHTLVPSFVEGTEIDFSWISIRGRQVVSGQLPHQKLQYDQLSSEAQVTSRIPQGSVLNPLLFLIFINNRTDNDCVLYRHITSFQDCISLQMDLDMLQEWESKWLMEFHPSKCQVFHITNKQKVVLQSYNIHDHTLAEVNSAKYLGVHIDSKLNFNTHMDATVKKGNSNNALQSLNFS
uniref:Reverse transcriptase domain-containing protein n=1 Tax=Eptatretus burgeri TaxID=7764 RepID=A0A8C4WX16_EPTBU